MARTAKGQIKVIEDRDGNLRIQIPNPHAQYYYQKNQKYICYGAKNTQSNMIAAMNAALELQTDIESNEFNPLETAKYKHSNKQLGNYNHIKSISIISLFNDFVKNLIIEPTTRDTVYLTHFNHLKRMTDQHEYTLKQQSEIDIWIRNNTAESAIILLLALLNRMIEWGKKESKLPKDFLNKFKQYEQDFKKSLRGQRAKRKPPAAVAHLATREGIQAHSEENRDKIIAAFHSRHRSKYYSSRLDHTAYLVEFLFLTGCRHGEAFALVWKDIEYGRDRQGLPQVRINIDESFNSKKRITKNTKTRKHRKVPATNRVVEILEMLKPENPDPNLLVFRNTNDKNFSTNLMTGLWIPTVHDPANGQIDYSIIGKMIRDGELDYYMDFYSTRRTFASIQINKGVPANVVAKWIGDNVETVLKHYARPDDDAVPY